MRQLAVCANTDPAGRLILHLRGEVDLAVHAPLMSCLQAALAGPATSVVADLAGLTFLDAGGAAVLLDAAERARRAGSEFSFTGAEGIVEQVLSIVAGWHRRTGNPPAVPLRRAGRPSARWAVAAFGLADVSARPKRRPTRKRSR